MSKKDYAIKLRVEDEVCAENFFNKVLIDHPALDEVEEEFHDLELFRVCHIWQGPKDYKGYGRYGIYIKDLGTFSVKAHRFAFAHEFGFDALPVGAMGGEGRKVLNHLCHNRLCVNPYHLEVITNDENISPEKRKPKDA
jgi:hypothetical protein